MEVQSRCPAFAVHPDAVHLVFARQLLHLRDQELVGIGEAVGAGDIFGGLAVRPDDGVLGVLGAVIGVPHAGIVHIQGDVLLQSHLPPKGEGVALKLGHTVAEGGGIRGPAGMALAVDLDKVGLHLAADFADVLLLQGGADHTARFGPCVEIEM